MTAFRPHIQSLNTGYAQDPDILRLHLNESPYGAAPQAVEAATAQLAAGLAVYPDSESIALRRRIARHFDVGEDAVAVGNGVEELVLLTALTFLKPEEPVLVTETTFPGYLAATALAGGVVKTVPLRDNAVCAPDLAATVREQGHLTFVCNPHNPMGTVLDGPAVAQIAAAAEESGAVVVFDEAYIDFAGPPYEYALRAVRDGRRVIVMRSFSKAWGLAALRIGLAIGPVDLMNRIRHTRQAQPFGVNRLAQHAAAAALDRPDFVHDVRHRTAQARDRLYRGLDAIGVGYVPSVANFVMVRTGGDSARIATRLAEEHRILVRDLTGFGLPGNLRVTVGTAEQVDRFCAALGTVLAGPHHAARREHATGGPAAAGRTLAEPAIRPAVEPAALFNGFAGANVVYALSDLKVWDHVAARPATLTELATATGARPAKLLALLRVAALLGYLDLNDPDVSLTPAGRELVHRIGYFTWGVGGYGSVLHQLGGLATGDLSFGVDVRRDEARVAAGVGQAGRALMGPIEDQMLGGLDFAVAADLGCGDGSRLVRLCAQAPTRRGIGVDISQPACDLANSRIAEAGLGDRVEIRCADVLDLAARGTVPGVDLVMCFHMLHDLFAATRDPPAAIAALRGLFPDTQRFVFADNVAYDWDRHRGPLPIFTVQFELVHTVMDTPIVDRRTYEDAFAAVGLRIEERVPFGTPSSWLYRLVAS